MRFPGLCRRTYGRSFAGDAARSAGLRCHVILPIFNTAAGASWVSIHNGGGVGIGYSQHAGMVVVADGTDESDRRLERVLTSDPGLGVVRHADAGYEKAAAFARERGIQRPMS